MKIGKNMTQAQELFLKVLSAALSRRQPLDKEQSLEEQLKKCTVSWQELRKIAKEQALSLLVDDYILEYELINLTEREQEELQNQAISAAMMYYHMVNFVFRVLSLTKQEKIHSCILKGVGLSSYYPKEEVRKIGDMDLYIPIPEEFEHFCRILKKQGFEQEKTIADHHLSFFYLYSGTRFELEVHKKPISSQGNRNFNKEICQVFKPFTEAGNWSFPEVKTISGKIPILPKEENTFYLLLHMLQHFLSGGMGLRMLCDWVVIWRDKGQKENFSLEKYLSFVHKSKIEGFHYIITGLCITFLGLSLQDVPWMEGHMPRKETMDIFMEDIFHGGEFGEKDSARMFIALEKPGIILYCKELHRQMRLRFQNAGRFPFLWPFLWFTSLIIFFYNNKLLRKTSIKLILKSGKERAKLIEEIRLFKD